MMSKKIIKSKWKTTIKRKKLKEKPTVNIQEISPFKSPEGLSELEFYNYCLEYIKKNKGKTFIVENPKHSSWHPFNKRIFIIGEDIFVYGDRSVGIPSWEGILVYADTETVLVLDPKDPRKEYVDDFYHINISTSTEAKEEAEFYREQEKEHPKLKEK